MMANGTTGDHPRKDSPPQDGPGTRATGIMEDMSSNTSKANGTDIKEENGPSTRTKYQ